MWAKVDDGFWCHPKVMGLSGSACGLWVRALSWSCAQRTEFVPVHFLGMVRATAEDAAELVAAGLWVESDGAWIIHDWAQYQELSTSEKRAEAGRRGGRRSGEARRSKPKQNEGSTCGDGEANRSTGQANVEAGTHPVPTRPVPAQPADAASIIVASPLDVNRAVHRFGVLAAERAGADKPDRYAAKASRSVTDADRTLLADVLASGASVDGAAMALLDARVPLRPIAPVVDPVEAERARERASRNEQETRARLAEQAAVVVGDGVSGLAAARTNLRSVGA